MILLEDNMTEGNTARKRKNNRGGNVFTIPLQPGTTIQKIKGVYAAYMLIPGRNAGGVGKIEIEDGEKLREISNGCWIVQPVGAPTLNAKGVSHIISRSIVWVHNLARRGPFDLYGGLQGYVMNPRGDEWIPKNGKGRSGSEVLFYREDVQAWMEEYAPPEQIEENIEHRKKMDVPAGMFNLFFQLGEPEQQKAGYVTRTRVIAEAKAVTRNMSAEELHCIGLEKPISDRDYDYLIATALKLHWGDNPKKVFNTATYRRKPRTI